MITRRVVVSALALGTLALTTSRWWASSEAASAEVDEGSFPASRADAEWRRRLTPAQYSVLRQSGTERPFTSPLLTEHRQGTFACAGCGREDFASATKFESGTGWPSFWAALDGAVLEQRDRSFGMARTAVRCSACGGHLGHVFDDGPKPTGLRYCMNGVALSFTPSA